MVDLSGRTAIVTGGARGIGASLARGLANAGAKLVLLDLRADVGEALAREIGEASCRFMACDVADSPAVEGAFREADAFLGSLDILICSAGLDKPGYAAEDIPVDVFDRLMNVNARGTFLANQQAARRMKTQKGRGGGTMVNLASFAGIRGMPERAAYSAAKGAVLAWTRAAAGSWAEFDITVNALAPTMATEAAERYIDSLTPGDRQAMDEQLDRVVPLGGRLGVVETDLLPLVLMLCGQGGRYITGQCFAVDGGRTMLGS
ncbi:SDR family NAD(P)-dependent oxidoreductase [Sphingopyxis sp.]|uniref:SDR family NAD(P)-dependent oxidoreductase n=1 Tax=Sphingopyxis sp. TaxID=1908224 RepID=UPI003D6CCCCB